MQKLLRQPVVNFVLVIRTFIAAFALLLVIHATVAAQSQTEQETPTSRESSEQASPSDEEQTSAPGAFREPEDDTYPVQAQVGKPGDIEDDFQTSFPKSDAVFSELVPSNWVSFKQNLYGNQHVKLATSYQSLFMWPSDVLQGPNHAAAGFFLLEGKWDALRSGKDYQGGIVASVFDVHVYGDAAAPLGVFAQTGSMVNNDAAYTNIDFAFSNLYWEQWLEKDRLVFRLGQHQAINVLDFFRYADLRTSFSGPALAFPAASIPFAPPGPGVNFKWWPKKDSELYVVGTVVDINSEIDELDWSPIFETGDVFAGVEVGYNWKRMGSKGGEMDHLHLMLFHADEATRKDFPTEAGWGLKVAGEKQWGKWVSFANYVYNNSRGGGFGFTFYEHAVNAGVAYNKPLGIRGEIAGAVTWAQQLDGGGCGFIPCDGSDQYGTELYWKILLAPDFWITPGLQLAINPVLNPDVSVVAVPVLKFRLFF